MISWTSLSSWLLNFLWTWEEGEALITFGMWSIFLLHSTFLSCPTRSKPQGISFGMPQKKQTLTAGTEYFLISILPHWKRVMAATQQVTSSSQPGGGSCGCTCLIKHNPRQIDVLWTFAKWFGKDIDLFAKWSLETTNIKSIIKQLYTESLDYLEFLKNTKPLRGFSYICTERDPF